MDEKLLFQSKEYQKAMHL